MDRENNINNMEIDSDSDDLSNHCTESNSSTSSSSGSSDDSDSEQLDTEETTETAKIMKKFIELPKGLCENENIFNEFFSIQMWNGLPEPIKQHLKVNYLPKFPTNDELNKDITINDLFSRTITRFDKSPLTEFQTNLEDGNYRPEIVRLRSSIKKSQKREQKFLKCERISQIAKSVMISREKLLRAAYDSPPGVVVKVERITPVMPKFTSTPAAARAKKRYFQELGNISEELGIEGQQSEDENYPEGPPAQLSRKQKRHLNGIQGGASSPGAEARVYSTLAPRGGNLDHLVGPGGTAPLSEEFYRQMIATHKKRKLDDPEHPDLDISEIKLKDVHMRTQLAAGHRRPLPHSKLFNGGSPSTLRDVNNKKPIQPISKVIKQEVNSFQTQFNQQLVRSQSLLMVGTNQTNTTISNIITNNSVHSFSEESDAEFSFKVIPKTEPLIQSSPPELISTVTIRTPTTNLSQQTSNPYLPLAPISSNIMPDIKLQQTNNTNINNVKRKVNNNNNSTVGGTLKTNEIVNNHHHNISVLPSTSIQQSNTILLNHNLRPGIINLANYTGKVKPATFSDLEGIDMMRIPVDLDESGNIDILNDIDTSTSTDKTPELMQETHACFLSLIRDIFCSTPDHRTTLENLQKKIYSWLGNPITPLNDWYSLNDNWLNLLPSAINFLSGEFTDQPEDYVPYIEYKINLHIYQWIGAGRDTDTHLMPLCSYWLSRKHEMVKKPIKNNTISEGNFKTSHSHKAHVSHTHIELDDDLPPEKPCSPPPPRFPTSWTVSRALQHEVDEFRVQERTRFEYPHLAFTYRMHGYESVVGPVKGIYTHQVPGVNKARGHNMLVADRPNFVTILTLVRDATARLPNGEGTRTDICELLKSSQYISHDAPDAILQTIVSGALDRMHTEHDPCVRYDPKRKIWIYLHRNRSKEEFERLHQQYQGLGKHKKTTPRKFKSKKLTTSTSCKTTQAKTTTTNAVIPTNVIVVASTPMSNTPMEPLNHQPPSLPPMQMPALSSISSPLSTCSSPNTSFTHNLQSHPPPLINKIPQQKPTSLKPELVPIKMVSTQSIEKTIPELIDVEASLDAQNTPVLINIQSGQPATQNQLNPHHHSPVIQSMPGLIIDKQLQAQKINKIIANNKNLIQAPMKISTASGIQTVHVSTSSPSSNKPLTSILASSNSQSILLNQNRSHSPIVVSTGVGVNKKLSKPILISQNQAPSLISSPSSSSNTITGQSYIIPINLTSQNSPKLIKTLNNPPALASTTAQKSILQTTSLISATTNKSGIIRNNQTIQSGKSLINPAIVQQRGTVISATPNTIQKQVQVRPNVSIAKTTLTQSTLTAAQQKQLLQNIIVQQSKQNQNQRNTATLVATSPSGGQSIKSIIITPTQNQTQNIMNSTSTSNKSIITTTASSPGSSLINPQIIQIQSNNQQHGKIQSLTPQQQQSLLATLKQHQMKNNQQRNLTQQSLIIKQQPIIQQTTSKSQNVIPTSTSIIKSGQSLLGTNFIVSSSPSLSTTTTPSVTKIINSPQPLVTRIIKPGPSIIQQQQQQQQQQHNIQRVNKSNSTTPVTAKVLTNQSGQIISLESLLQKSGFAPGTTLRVAGSKPGQTSLIQLASAPGSQVTQYAVVSQGRNIIPIQNTQRIITSSVPQTQTISTTTMSNIIKTEHKPQQIQTTTGTLLSNQTSTSSNLQQQQNKMIHQVQTVSAGGGNVGTKLKPGIRMVNTSNLNLTQFGGKPVIIASKTTGQQGNINQIQGQNVILQSTGQNSANGTNYVIQGGQALKLQGNLLSPQTQTVMFNNQLVKVQTQPNIMGSSTQNIISSRAATASSTTTTSIINQNAVNTGQKTVVLGSAGGQTITKIQTQGGMSVSNVQNQQQTQQHVVLGTTLKNTVKGVANNQRLVFAVQGGGQLFLPHGFQTGAINLKSLQGLKVIPMQQNQQNKVGGDERQVYAQIITPQTTRSSNISIQGTTNINNNPGNASGNVNPDKNNSL